MTPAGFLRRRVSATSYANFTGWPSVIVPAGMPKEDNLPVTIAFFGRAWSEPKLLAYAYDFEQSTAAECSPSPRRPCPAT